MKIKSAWLKKDITCAWGSPQSIENRGYSVIAFSMVLVLSHITAFNPFRFSAYQMNAGLTRNRVITGSHWYLFRRSFPVAYSARPVLAKTVGNIRLNAIVDFIPVITPSTPIIQ